MNRKPDEARSDPGRRMIKREVLIMSLLAGALLIAGAVYTALRGSSSAGLETRGPVQVHSEGPATMTGPPAMERHPPGDVPPPPPRP